MALYKFRIIIIIIINTWQLDNRHDMRQQSNSRSVNISELHFFCKSYWESQAMTLSQFFDKNQC